MLFKVILKTLKPFNPTKCTKTMPFLKNVLSNHNNKILLLVSVLYVLPLVLAGEYYIDDMGRAVEGYGWHFDGRFLATYLMELFSFGEKIFNFFPFSIIVSAALLGFSGLIVSMILGLENNSKFRFSSLVILTSPFMLENLSYRYDAIFMALSVFIVILPFLYFKQQKYFFFLSCICIYLAFGLFQVSAMTYFAMLLCVALMLIIRGDLINVLKIVSLSILSFVIAYMAYKGTLDYLQIEVPDRGSLLILENGFFNTFLKRVQILFNVINSDLLSSKYFIPIVFLLFISLFGLLQLIWKKRKNISQLAIILIAFTVATLCVFLLIGMPGLIIKEHWWTARTFLAYPFLIYVFLILQKELKYDNFIKLSLIPIIVFSFLLSSILGATLTNKSKYTDFLITQMAPYTFQPDIHNIVVAGGAPIAPRNRLAYIEFPILYKLAPIYESEGWSWGLRSLSRYANYQWPNGKEELVSSKCDYGIVFKNTAFALRKVENTMIIDFDYRACLNDTLENYEGPPVIEESGYSIYINHEKLIYINKSCSTKKTQDPFYLHIVPEQESDLPATRKQYGFDNLDFAFGNDGYHKDTLCIIERSIPTYPIKQINTGQFNADGQVWSGSYIFPVDP